MLQYEIVEKRPDALALHALRRSVGFNRLDAGTVALGLEGSLYAVYAMAEGGLIGFARVIGDGVTAFYIQDVIVAPEWQGRGVGRAVMEHVMGYIEGHACADAIVGLMCAKGKDGFYEKFGFWSRPNERFGPGMMQFWKKSTL